MAEPDTAALQMRAPEVVVCDDGELQDVVQALERLGERPLRVRPEELADLAEWDRPRRLFVTSVRTALSRLRPPGATGSEAVAIAVVEEPSRTLCAALLRRGFRYVIRRPVHPEALRLLLRQVLFLGREQRRVTRFPFGGEVRWRRGLRRGRCAMSEISAHGCRILTEERFVLGDRVHLRVASALRDGRTIRLKARVVRRDGGDPATRPRGTQVALRFEGLSTRTRADLDALLAERASGPVSMPAEAAGAPGPARAEAARPTAAKRGAPPRPLQEATPAAPEAAGTPDPPSRRRTPRAVWREEVVALAGASEEVAETLLGRDLSRGGMRVEPHPALRLGDVLRLALFEPATSAPLVLDARVARDDGRLGCALVFQDLDAERVGRLERMVEALPSVSTLDEGRGEPEGVVLGGIVLVKAVVR